MGSQERDISRIRVQITVAKWHLHRALSGIADVAVHELECARLAYAETLRSLSEAKLTKKEREEIRRELGELQSRLDADPKASPEARAAQHDEES